MVDQKTAIIKKKGDRGGINPGGSGTTGNLPYAAIPSSGQADSIGQIPKKRRVIGTGEH